jgi:transcriptional regulator with XRE-family HTH domain
VTPRTSIAQSIGIAIRARRKEANLTAAEAASLAGVSRRLLVELELGKRPNVSLGALLRILQVLGLDLAVRPRGLPGAGHGTVRGNHDV